MSWPLLSQINLSFLQHLHHFPSLSLYSKKRHRSKFFSSLHTKLLNCFRNFDSQTQAMSEGGGGGKRHRHNSHRSAEAPSQQQQSPPSQPQHKTTSRNGRLQSLPVPNPRRRLSFVSEASTETSNPALFENNEAQVQVPPLPQYRPGVRIHVYGPQELSPSAKLAAALTLPARDARTPGGVGGSGGMGNQGIRQHVETSTKTGVFHLSKAKLHEFPPELAKIVNALRSIDLSENKITLIPQNISAFVNLKHLNLNSNQIEIIPDQIGQLSKLETLSLANNRIKSVPATIAHLQKLRDANLNSNALSSFPVVFSSLKFLTVLDLARNRITEVPDGVGGLQVVELILNQNQVRAVSKDLALCPNLKTLRLQENTLELAGLPKEILSDSPVSLLSVEGNLFDVKQLSDLEGYDKYMDRYTNTKKKLT